jgi:hypothetical protein
LFGKESHPLGLLARGILFQLPQLKRDLGTLAVEGGGSLQPLAKLLRKGGLLGEERGKLATFGAEPFVEHCSLLQRCCEPLFQLAQSLGVAVELFGCALMALPSLLERRFELSPFLLGTRACCFQLGNPRCGFALPGGVAPLTRFLFLQPAGETALLTAQLVNSGFERKPAAIELA